MALHAQAVQPGELTGRAASLIPALRERAPEAERLRHIPEESVQDIRRLGLARTLRPLHYGGFEQDYRAFAHVVREVARGCASTGWCCGAWLSQAFTLTTFPVEAQDEVCLADPDALIASTGVPSARIERTQGGWRVNGRWGFASGIHAATWVIAAAASTDGPQRTILLPTAELEILDTWHSVGLRGTGSTDTVAKDLFVPEHRCIPYTTFLFGHPTGPAASGPMRNHSVASTQVNSIIFAPAAVGNALGFIDAFAETAAQRTITYARVKQSDHAGTQMRYAESALEVDLAGMLLERCYDEMDRHAETGEIDRITRSRMRRDTSFAVNLSYRAIDRVYQVTGAHALIEPGEMQRRWRDAHAIASQPQMHFDYEAETWARLRLGLGTDHPAVPPDKAQEP